MIWDLFVVDSIPFFILCAAALIFVVMAMAEENGIGATVVLLLFSLVLWLFGDFNVFKAIWHNPHTVGVILGVYLLGGFVYVWPKWWAFNHSLKDQLQTRKQRFLDSNGITEAGLTDDLYRRWTQGGRDDFAREIGNRDGSIIPKVRNYKSKVTTWMMYWPFSLLYTLTHDLANKVWNTVWHAVHDGLQKISTRIFSNADFKYVPKPENTPSQPVTPPARW